MSTSARDRCGSFGMQNLLVSALNSIHSPGGSGAPTCMWLKSRSVTLSSSLMPFVKLGSFSRWFRADSGMFCKTRNLCRIACRRS